MNNLNYKISAIITITTVISFIITAAALSIHTKEINEHPIISIAIGMLTMILAYHAYNLAMITIVAGKKNSSKIQGIFETTVTLSLFHIILLNIECLIAFMLKAIALLLNIPGALNAITPTGVLASGLTITIIYVILTTWMTWQTEFKKETS